MEITGSSIKRVDAESALPVQTVSREQIATLGVTNTEQLLQNISANSSAGGMTSAQNAGQSTYGESNASLRGLGSQRTLVLVNGRRIANYATDGTAVDINSIPLSAIDRVEILKDGASGVYGSDAVAGVINFILRKDFHGVEMTGYYGKPTTSGGGKSGKVGLVAGFGDIETDHVTAMFSLDVAHDAAIQGYQRKYANRSWSDDGLFDQSATATGAIRTFDPNMLTNLNQGKALYADGSGIGNILGPTSPGSTANNCSANGMSFDVNYNTCRYNPSPFVPLTPDVTRVNVAGTLRGRINEDNEWFAEAFVSNAKTTISEQASPYSASFLATDPLFHKIGVNPDILINASSPYYPTAYINAVNAQNAAYNAANPTLTQKPIVAAGDPVAVSYRALDGGGRLHTDNSTQYHFVTGFTGSVKDWDYDASYGRNESTVSESTQRGYQNQTQLVELLSGNNAFDPFVAQQTPALAAQILATNYNGNIIKSSLTTDSIDLKVQHELAQLPGGALAFAAGLTLRREALDLQPSAAYQSGDVSGYGAAVLPFTASRTSHSIYGEIDAPFLKILEADLSVRNDHYPTASSTNPKISMKFRPIDQVAFRGAVGTGFREPALPELYTPLAPATTNIFTDPVTGAPGQFNEEIGGNPKLVPEKSKQFSLGAIVEPVRGLSASADYYHVRVDHAIIALDAETVVDLAAQGNPVYAPLVSRDSSGNITNILAPDVNSGGVVTAGVDVDVKWAGLRTAVGQFSAELAGTWIQKYDLTTIDGTVQHSVGRTTDPSDSAIQAISNSGGMIFRWKHSATVNWNYAAYGLAFTQNYQSSYRDAPPAIDDCDPGDYTAPAAPPAICATGRRVSSFATYDLQGQYSGVKNVTFRLGLKNVFNRQPPTVTTNGLYFQAGYDPTYYDPHGRFIYGSASYKF